MPSNGFTHENKSKSDIRWITPPEIIETFNKLTLKDPFFDLDPCADITQPWKCAKNQYTINDNGLDKSWIGTVYCNPPYGDHLYPWIKKLSDHGTGIALIFARTDTPIWHEVIFNDATAILFIRKRLHFYRPDGSLAGSASAPSALISFGSLCQRALLEFYDAGVIPGSYIKLKPFIK